MPAIICTVTDERNQHAVIVTQGTDQRIFTRSSSGHTADAIAAVLSRDIIRHGFAALADRFDRLPVAEYRITKRGRRVLIAEAQ